LPARLNTGAESSGQAGGDAPRVPEETFVPTFLGARTVGSKAAARVQRIASHRAQHMATGTWQRYRMSRGRRIRLWLRDAQESLEDVLQRLRGAVRGD
jgi:hypothetical protein